MLVDVEIPNVSHPSEFSDLKSFISAARFSFAISSLIINRFSLLLVVLFALLKNFAISDGNATWEKRKVKLMLFCRKFFFPSSCSSSADGKNDKGTRLFLCWGEEQAKFVFRNCFYAAIIISNENVSTLTHSLLEPSPPLRFLLFFVSSPKNGRRRRREIKGKLGNIGFFLSDDKLHTFPHTKWTLFIFCVPGRVCMRMIYGESLNEYEDKWSSKIFWRFWSKLTLSVAPPVGNVLK